MATIPSKPTVDMTDWITGQTRLNRTNLVNGINTNLQSLKTAADGTIDALIEEDAAIATKQPLLVSGTNIKTVNGQNILGAGDVSFDAATNDDIWSLFHTLPQKGDIIYFDALGDGTQKRFRLIKIEGTIALLLSMDDDINSAYGTSDSKVEFDDGNYYQEYDHRAVDQIINTTYYDSLSSDVKNAIVATNRVQSCWKHGTASYGSDDFIIRRVNNGQLQYYQRATQKSVGDRKCFSLDVDEVAEYLGATGGNIIDGTELMNMFFEQTSFSTWPAVWLMSAYANDPQCAFVVYGHDGYLGFNFYFGSSLVRPAFRIDLSQIDYVIE